MGFGIPSFLEGFVPGKQNAELQRDANNSQFNRTVTYAPGQPNPAPSGGSTGGGGYYYGGGSGGDGGAAARAAEAARKAQIDALRNQVMTSRAGALSGAQSGVNTLENSYMDKVTPFVRKVQEGVENVNQSNANNLLNLRRTNRGIANDVRTGNRSLGVRLANMNALDSGAAIAGARAYAQAGNSQSQDARNQAELQEQELVRTTDQLRRERDDAILSFDQFRNVSVDSMGRELQNQLDTLLQQAIAGGVEGNVINPVNDRNSITNQAFSRLAQIDARRDADLAAAKFLTPEEAEALAVQMDAAGAAANPFAVGNIDVEAPQGAPIGQLPILARRPEDERDSVLNPSLVGA